MSQSNGSANGVQAPKAATSARKLTHFRVVLELGEDRYYLWPVRDVDPAVAVRAFGLKKLTGKERVTYHCHLGQYGPECDCKGFLRWHRCKHLRALVALGLFPNLGCQEGNGRG